MAERERFMVWFAGFFDGEGNVAVRRSGESRLAVRLSVAQVSGNNGEEICSLIQRHFGGNVRSTKPSNNDGHKRQVRWDWDLSNRSEVHALLTELTPLLLVKRPAAMKALELINSMDATLINRKKWSNEEISFINTNYLSMPYRQIASELNRGVKATRNFIATLGLPNKIERRAN